MAQHSQALLDETVVPVCVWRAGKVAAALRKASVSCMHKLMTASLIPGDALMAALGKGFEPGPLDPVIKSCLDDDDADVRFMTCGALRSLFVSVEGRLDDEQVGFDDGCGCVATRVELLADAPATLHMRV